MTRMRLTVKIEMIKKNIDGYKLCYRTTASNLPERIPSRSAHSKKPIENNSNRGSHVVHHDDNFQNAEADNRGFFSKVWQSMVAGPRESPQANQEPLLFPSEPSTDDEPLPTEMNFSSKKTDKVVAEWLCLDQMISAEHVSYLFKTQDLAEL